MLSHALRRARNGRIMIWNSIPFMTAIDLMIIAMTIYAIWRCQLIGPSKRPSALQIGLRLIALGLVVVCMFYFVDLMSYRAPVREFRRSHVRLPRRYAGGRCNGFHGHSPSQSQLAGRSVRHDRHLRRVYRA